MKASEVYKAQREHIGELLVILNRPGLRPSLAMMFFLLLLSVQVATASPLPWLIAGLQDPTVNPHVPYQVPTSVAVTNTHMPTTDSVWEIYSPIALFYGDTTGQIVASNSSPGGWSVVFNGATFTITVPDPIRDPAAAAGSGYEIRYNNGGQGKSATFNLVPVMPSNGSMAYIAPLGDSTQSGVWDVVHGGVIDTSAWILKANGPHSMIYGSPYGLTLLAPSNTLQDPSPGLNYEFRYTDGAFGYSCIFDVGFSVPLYLVPNPTNGVLPDAMTLPDWMSSTVPTDEPDAPGGDTATSSGGPSSPLSVDLVHGVLSVDSGPDIIIPNPYGPDLAFERQYRSALAAGNVSSPGLPAGWTHNFDYRIIPSTNRTTWMPLQLVYPSGATELLTPHTDQSGTNLTSNILSPPAGAPYAASGAPTGTPNVWQSITIRHIGLASETFTQDAIGNFRLATETFANGSSVAFYYAQDNQHPGRLDHIDTLAAGRTTTTICQLNYGAINSVPLLSNITTIGSPSFSRNYTYASFGTANVTDLSTVSQVNSTNTEWTYIYQTLSDNLPFLTSVQTADPAGTQRTATVAYDGNTGRVSSFQDSKNNSRVYGYLNAGGAQVSLYGSTGAFEDRYTASCDSLGRTSTIANAHGDTTSISYSANNPSIASLVRYPLGNQTVTTVDAMGNVTDVQYPYGNHLSLTWDESLATLNWAPLGLLTSVSRKDRNGANQTGLTQYAYYAPGEQNGIQGAIKTVTVPDGATYTYAYTSLGNVSTITAPTNTITYGYTTSHANQTVPEAYGQPQSVSDHIVVPGTQNFRKVWFQYDAAGRVTGSWDPYDNFTSVGLNGYDQPTSISLPLNHSLQFSYGPTGTSIGKVARSATLSMTGQQVSLFSNDYDNESDVSVSRDGNSNHDSVTLGSQFDLRALLDGNSNQMHHFVPDPLNNKVAVTLGSQTRQLNFTSQFDANGNYQQVAGASDNLNPIVLPNSLDPDLPFEIETRLTSSTWGTADYFNQFQYDTHSRVQEADVLGATLTTGSSHLWSNPINEPGCFHTYTYDSVGGHLQSDTVQDGLSVGGSSQSVTYIYDSEGRRAYMFVQLDDPRGNSVGPANYACYIYTYDAASRLSSIKVQYSPDATGSNIQPGVIAEADYEYDANDRVTAVRLPSRGTTLYSYDALGQLTSLYNLTPDNTLDPRDQGNAYELVEPNGKYHTKLSDFTGFQFDVYGNRTAMSFEAETVTGTQPNWSQFSFGSASFTYDNGGRLQTETWNLDRQAQKGFSHGYDHADNLTTIRGVPIAVDQYSDQLTTGTTYDPTGQEATSNGMNYWFHPTGGLALIAGNTYDSCITGNHLAFNELCGYDANGLRDYQSVTLTGAGNDNEAYLYDGDEMVMRWSDGPQNGSQSSTDLGTTQNAAVLYLWGPTGLAMEFDTQGHSKAFFYDPEGSCINTSDGLSQYPTFYDGYGQQLWPYSTINDAPDKRMMQQPFQYKGQYGYYTDVHTGLCYCHHRYYDPATGRWLSRDPAGLEGGVNVYGYCDGNPIRGADPTGLQQGLMNPFDWHDPMGAPWRAWREVCGADSPSGAVEFWHQGAKHSHGLIGGVLKIAVAGPAQDPDLVWWGVVDIAGDYACMGLGVAGPEFEAAEVVEAGEGFLVVGEAVPKSPNLLGLEGENAVRGVYNIGPKERLYIGPNEYIVPDGIRPDAVSEIKNVAQQSLTKQIRAYQKYAQATNRQMHLYVREGAKLSKPLVREVAAGRIKLRFIPK